MSALFLERSRELDRLHEYYRDASRGDGRLVFLGGEMGVGKSTLIENFALEVGPRARLSVISCDGLTMPGPLGLLFDLAAMLGPEVEQLLASQAPRAQLFRSVEHALIRAPDVTVLVAEDAHWSDEASLDLFRFLGRRINHLRVLFIVTYRNDELPHDHPLRRVMGDLASSPSVRRMLLSPLSVTAVAELAGERPVNPVELHTYTGGNPFYLVEVLESGTLVPISMRDAILGRASRLSSESRTVLDAAATIGEIVDPDVLRDLVEHPIEDAVEEGLAVGLFRPNEKSVMFRHAAVRSALLEAISPPRYLALQRRIVACLRNRPGYATDYARLAFHAEEAGDRTAVMVYAMAAAKEAVAFQSHRQAAEQFARVVRFAEGLPSEELATVLEAQAYECQLTGRVDDAVRAQRQASVIREEAGDPLRLGDNLRKLSRYCWFDGKGHEADRYARRAFELLEQYPRSRELAMACSHLSAIRALSSDAVEAISFGNRAIELANDLGDVPILVHALTTSGTFRLEWNDEGGRPLLEQALDLARTADLAEDVGRALENLAWIALIHRDPRLAERYLSEGLAFTAEHDFLTIELLLRADRAMLYASTGRWSEARKEAGDIARHPTAPAAARIIALVALGLTRVRTGESLTTELDRALELAGEIEELQYRGLVRAARAEAAWLAGDLELAAVEASAASSDALRYRNPWIAGELALWLHRAGHTGINNSGIPNVFVREIRGEWATAHDDWQARGLPFEAARAQSSSTGETELLTALSTFDSLGARPDADRVSRRLRELGFHHIPRGPRPGTRARFGRITRREIEVLTLLDQGRTNREIAQRLYLSPKTVGNHVSAILTKLDVSTRAGAVDRARQVGLLPK